LLEDRAAQLVMISTKPMSLPPIPSVTRLVRPLNAMSCGGLDPPVTCWGLVMSAVVAPLQLTSWNADKRRLCRTSDG
jgi:hypothetical protein